MKRSIFTLAASVLAVAATSATPAFADVSGESAAASAAELCRTGESTDRTLRACTAALKAAPPSRDLRTDLYTRRALHNLAMGDKDKAARDFKFAARLGDSEALAALGAGFKAVDRNEPRRARAAFDRCSGNDDVLALAQYGLGLSYDLEGDPAAAREAFARAQVLQPAWELPAG